MAKLTYWVAVCTTDSQCYNVRAKTKKAVIEGVQSQYNPNDFEKPKKVVVEYTDALDLLKECMGEGRGWWE